MPTGQLLHLDGRLTDTSPAARPDALVVPSSTAQRSHRRTFCVYVDARDARDFAELIAPARLVAVSGAGDAAVLMPGDTRPNGPAVPLRLAAPDAGRFLTTVLMTDIVDSTRTVARLGDRRWSELLAGHYADCSDEAASAGGELVETTGDGVVATFDTPTRAMQAGFAIQAAARRRGIAVRGAVHTGECERMGAGVAGLALHIASRVCELAGANELITTGTVRELVVGSTVEFEARGVRTLRGVPGEWPVFRVSDPGH
jgi:class 3 adenylate cyclase